MEHTIYHSELGTEISIDETMCENTCICIEMKSGETTTNIMTHYLSPNDLDEFIEVLQFIRDKKKRKFTKKPVSLLSLSSIKKVKENFGINFSEIDLD